MVQFSDIQSLVFPSMNLLVRLFNESINISTLLV